jgi:hypothetical protein
LGTVLRAKWLSNKYVKDGTGFAVEIRKSLGFA